MLNPTIRNLPSESTSLELHTELCAARYQQICHGLDTIESALLRMDADLAAVAERITANQDRLHDRIFAWGSATIAALVGSVVGLVTHSIIP